MELEPQYISYSSPCGIQGDLLLAGVDEAGRGPLAGPVVAAAVVLPTTERMTGLADSKKLSERQRESLFPIICDRSIAYAIAFVGPRAIEHYNIRRATQLAMEAAAWKVLECVGMRTTPSHCHFIVDGNMEFSSELRNEPIVKADHILQCVSAASILAKVARDAMMKDLDLQYPGYGFSKHKGYPTAAHRQQIQLLGPSREHRRTFAGVKEHL